MELGDRPRYELELPLVVHLRRIAADRELAVTSYDNFASMLSDNMVSLQKLFFRLGHQFDNENLLLMKEVSWLCLNLCCFSITPGEGDGASPQYDVNSYFDESCEIVQSTAHAMQEVQREMARLYGEISQDSDHIS